MNWNILLLPQKITRTAFRSNFVNRSLKSPIIANKTDIQLNEPTFVQDIFNYLIKIGAKVVSHSRYVTFQMAEVVMPQTLFREILDRIRQLRFLAIPARTG